MKTVFYLPAAALLLALSAPAIALTPVDGQLVAWAVSDLRDPITGSPTGFEGSVRIDPFTTSFLNETIVARTDFDLGEYYGYGITGTMDISTSAHWTGPDRGTVSLAISHNVQGSALFPAYLDYRAAWIYAFQTGASPVLFSSTWNLSGEFAQQNGPFTFEFGGSEVAPVNNNSARTFTRLLPANGLYGVVFGAFLSGFAPGSLDGVGSGAAQINWSISAVPEPASWAMLIAGFGLTGASLRRRRALLGTATA